MQCVYYWRVPPDYKLFPFLRGRSDVPCPPVSASSLLSSPRNEGTKDPETGRTWLTGPATGYTGRHHAYAAAA